MHPDDQDRVVNTYLAAFARRDVYMLQHRFRRFDGEYRWMKSIGLPRLSPAGEFMGYVGSTFDITDLKEAEAALYEADRRKDEFVAILGHELRNPLAAISMGMTLLQSDAAAERRTWIEEMVARQVKQLQRLVEDLVDVSRIAHGKIEIRKQPVLLQEALEASIAAVEDVIARHDCQLSLSMPDEAIYLEVDPARLEQVILNLLTNAAKYSPSGGQIWLSAEIEGSEVIIRCRDTGQGLSSEALEAIFDPFMQLPFVSAQAPSGLGIGLTLVKKLVEMHGGSIKASSAGLGKGSEFTVRLPTGSPLRRAADMVQRSTPETAEPSRVLVVDDNRDLAESLGLFLRGAGHEVSVAHDGETAIPIAVREQPDFVLLDIDLPGMDGFAVVDRLRAIPALASTRIIAISGQRTPGDAMLESGKFDAFLVKPVLQEELLEFNG